MEQVGNWNSKEESKTFSEKPSQSILSCDYMVWKRISNNLFDYESKGR